MRPQLFESHVAAGARGRAGVGREQRLRVRWNSVRTRNMTKVGLKMCFLGRGPLGYHLPHTTADVQAQAWERELGNQVLGEKI